MGKILLIGGSGFVGSLLALRLIELTNEVGIVDIVRLPPGDHLKQCQFFQGSGTDGDFLIRTMKSFNPDIVIVIASFGMSGTDMLLKKCVDINVRAVHEVVRACEQCSVSKLIYTSSYNVVFGGQILRYVDEKIPYYPQKSHSDYYSISKLLAEDFIIKSNGKQLQNGQFLSTCALRPAAIYGEGEQRHFPRLLKFMDGGLFLFRIGDATVDWIHVENLVRNVEIGLSQIYDNVFIICF
jgi:nucleoside-diphosphate-sugar epimerase